MQRMGSKILCTSGIKAYMSVSSSVYTPSYHPYAGSACGLPLPQLSAGGAYYDGCQLHARVLPALASHPQPSHVAGASPVDVLYIYPKLDEKCMKDQRKRLSSRPYFDGVECTTFCILMVLSSVPSFNTTHTLCCMLYFALCTPLVHPKGSCCPVTPSSFLTPSIPDTSLSYRPGIWRPRCA